MDLIPHPLQTLATTFDEAHALTHTPVACLDEPPVPVYQGGDDTGELTDRVRFRYGVPSGPSATRLHEVRELQRRAFEALADRLVEGGAP